MKEIPLSKGMFALVSDEDFAYLSLWKWTASQESRGTKWYAIRWSKKSEDLGDGKRYKIRMHRVVEYLKNGVLGDDQVVDHLDDNGLNNQRENLERITQKENMHRSGGWKGGRRWKDRKTMPMQEPSL